jgi:hypothetical protein
MEDEEIMVLEEAELSSIDPEWLCCFLIYTPFRK